MVPFCHIIRKKTTRPISPIVTLWHTSLTGLALSEVGLAPQRKKKNERMNCGSLIRSVDRSVREKVQQRKENDTALVKKWHSQKIQAYCISYH